MVGYADVEYKAFDRMGYETYHQEVKKHFYDGLSEALIKIADEYVTNLDKVVAATLALSANKI